MTTIIDRANRDYATMTLTVGVPHPIAQLLDGASIKRWLTLQPIDDFATLSVKQKVSTIAKVLVVGLAIIGIGAAAALASPVVIWSIPLALIVAMGISFSLITFEKSGRELKEKAATQAEIAEQNLAKKMSLVEEAQLPSGQKVLLLKQAS